MVLLSNEFLGTMAVQSKSDNVFQDHKQLVMIPANLFIPYAMDTRGHDK